MIVGFSEACVIVPMAVEDMCVFSWGYLLGFLLDSLLPGEQTV